MCAALLLPIPEERDRKLKEATHQRVLDIARKEADAIIGLSVDIRLVDTIVEEAISVKRGSSDRISDDWIRDRIRKGGSGTSLSRQVG